MRRVSLLLAVVVLGAGACAQLLGFRPPQKRAFEHRAHAIEGIHCLHLPSDESCVTCHEKPHDTRPCGTCHGLPYARAGAVRARETLLFSHRGHMQEVKGDCVRCHVDAGTGAELLRPRMGHCLGCHGHEEEFETSRCEACHTDLLTEGTMPDDHLAHGPDFLREHGVRAAADSSLCASCHSERFCAGCHTGEKAPIIPERLAFDDPTTPGIHRAGFMSRHAEEARGDPGLCTTCHAPSACAACHARSNLDASGTNTRNPHPSGWLGLPGQRNEHGRAAWRDPALCASCHGGAGEALCVGCHRVGGPGGNPHPPGWTQGRNARTMPACVRCHEGGR